MPWWWPFSGGRGGYTDAITAAVEGAAAGGPAPSPGATAAAEACAGIIARALSRATIRPAHPAVTPAYLRRVGYDLVRNGEHLAVIEVRRGRVSLLPASTWTHHGERPWRVVAQLPAPQGTATRNVVEAGTVAVLWAENELQPWRGVGPLSGASLTAALLANAHRSLGAEQAQPAKGLLPVPKSTDTETARLRGEIARPGKLGLVESTAGGYGQGSAEAPKGDWTQKRIGADPPAGSVDLQDSAARQVIAACGVPLELLADVSAAARREAFRQFIAGTVEPLGLIIAFELADKLDTPALALTFEALAASDLAGRARAIGSLVKAGATLETAAAAAGLDGLEPAPAPPAGPDPGPMADGAP